MAKLTIANVPPLDGDYDLDIGSFTNRELHTIKQISGLRAGELKEAMEASDNDLIVAFAVIVLRRAGKEVHPDQIWDADLGAITIVVDEEVEEPRPPALLSPSGSLNASGGNGALSADTQPSGSLSSISGGAPVSDPSPIGLPGSGTTATSDRLISAS